MPTTIRGTTYFRTAEACGMAGISKNTFFRWLRSGMIEDVRTADRHGWRLFTDCDLTVLRDRALRAWPHKVATSEWCDASTGPRLRVKE
jgi:hypothetical protein